jgi:hypothetical protein
LPYEDEYNTTHDDSDEHQDFSKVEIKRAPKRVLHEDEPDQGPTVLLDRTGVTSAIPATEIALASNYEKAAEAPLS